MKTKHPIESRGAKILEKNHHVDRNLLAEVERLCREANLTQPESGFRLTPPLGGAIPTLKLYNT
jgi:hypothetical protein